MNNNDFWIKRMVGSLTGESNAGNVTSVCNDFNKRDNRQIRWVTLKYETENISLWNYLTFFAL
jgi:hypothetical protein